VVTLLASSAVVFRATLTSLSPTQTLTMTTAKSVNAEMTYNLPMAAKQRSGAMIAFSGGYHVAKSEHRLASPIER
jgi:hypothetical protein